MRAPVCTQAMPSAMPTSHACACLPVETAELPEDSFPSASSSCQTDSYGLYSYGVHTCGLCTHADTEPRHKRACKRTTQRSKPRCLGIHLNPSPSATLRRTCSSCRDTLAEAVILSAGTAIVDMPSAMPIKKAAQASVHASCPASHCTVHCAASQRTAQCNARCIAAPLHAPARRRCA